MKQQNLQYNTEDIKNIFLINLENYNISYILLSEFLGGNGGDIDVYILPSSYKPFIEIINQTGFYCQKNIPNYENHYFYYYYKEDYRPLRVHVKYELSFYDKVDNVYRYASFEKKIENNLIKTEFGYIASYQLALLLYASKCAFLEKQRLELRQIESLKLYIDKYIKNINDINDKKIILRIKNIINNIQDEENLIQISLRLREVLLPYYQNISEGKTYRKYLINRLKRFGKSNFSILFLGPDGAGKTTTIEFIKKKLDLPVSTLYGGVGSNGWIFSGLYTLREANKNSTFIRKALLKIVFSYALYPIELFARTIKASFNGKYCLLLIDRSPEVLINTKGINKIHDLVFPVPDIVVILKAPANILVERKPTELNLELANQKINNENKISKYYEKKGSKIITIDTSKISLDESKLIIEKEIWNCDKFLISLFKKTSNN